MSADANGIQCPACGAPAGVSCHVPIEGVDTAGWTHDSRILGPIVADLSARTDSAAER